MRHFAARAFALAFVSLFLVLSALADSMAGARGVSPVQPRVYGEPPLRNARTAAAVVATVGASTDADIAALRQHNAGNVPARVAVVHQLTEPVIAARGIGVAANEPFRWRGAVQVAEATRLRLKLTGVNAPDTAKFWVYGADGAAYGFDMSLAHQGTIWTPSVEGDTITVEGEGAAFTISAVADIRSAAEVVPMDDSCIEDAKCYTGLDELGTAIAHMQYMSGANGYICTGGLIIESRQTFVPYFLTANHCISTAAEAASLETFWDFKTSTCDGTTSLSGKPKVNGSTLLVTSAGTDMTLLRLTGLPSGGGSRFFLGWTSTLPAAGTTLYRLSHPQGQPLRFSTSTVTTAGGTCTGWPRPDFLYQTHAIGSTAGGSSGSPVVNVEGRVVGQLTGACGPDPDDPCNHGNRTVDGAFASSYALLKPFLNPDPVACSACVPNANTACMLNNRFKVTLTWNDPSANLSGNGRIISYGENRPITNPVDGEVSQVTFWSMYPNDPNSVEALVRMIRGGSSFWIFTTGFAAAEYTVTVQDTQKCTTWQRTSPFGATEKIADYNGLPF